MPTPRGDEVRRLREEARHETDVVQWPRRRAAKGEVGPETASEHRPGHRGGKAKHGGELIRPDVAVAVLVGRRVGKRRDEGVPRDGALEGDVVWGWRGWIEENGVVARIRKTVAEDEETADGLSRRRVEREGKKESLDKHRGVAEFHTSDILVLTAGAR